jgi:tetratricopeptide (TPR) repeat protein
MAETVKKWLFGFLLAAGTFSLFLPATGFDFVTFDDPLYVSANPHLAGGLTLSNVRWAFTTSYASNWHPLTWISHLSDVTLFGLDPAGHHLTSILLHAGSVTLLFFILRGLTGALLPSLFAAALFAVHPLRVESVVWISERKDALSVFLGLLTLGMYTIHVRRRSRAAGAMVVLCYAAGLLSKPMLVTLPLALLLLDYWPLGRFNGSRPYRDFAAACVEKLPLLVLSVIASVITVAAQNSGGAVVSTSEAPLLTRIANLAPAGLAYVSKTLAPINLSCFYPAPRIPLPWWTIAGSCAVLVALTVLAIRFRSRRPHLLTGWLWFLVTLVPVLGLVRVGDQFMADRYTYLPHVGLFAALAWEARGIAARTRALRLVVGTGAATLAVLALLTRAQTGVWRDGLTLFEHADAVTSDNRQVKYYLGSLYLRIGRPRDALRVYEEAVRIDPDYAEAHGNLGLALLALGRFSAAAGAEREALRLDPGLPEAANTLGNALAGLGRWDEAAIAHRRAISLRPDYPEAYNSLARALGRMNRTREAVESLEIAVRLRPDYSLAQLNLGSAYLALGRAADALAATRKAVDLDPELAEGHLQLGLICVQLGDRDCASREYELLQGINPGFAARIREEIKQSPGK